MSDQIIINMAKKSYDFFLRGNIEGIRTCALMMWWITPGPRTIPTAGKYVGKRRVQTLFANLAGAFELKKVIDLKAHGHTYSAEGNFQHLLNTQIPQQQ